MTLIGCFWIFTNIRLYPLHPTTSDIKFLQYSVIFGLCTIIIPLTILRDKINVSGSYIEYRGLFNKAIISELHYMTCRKFWIFRYVRFGSNKYASSVNPGWMSMFLIKASDYKMAEAMLLDFKQLDITDADINKTLSNETINRTDINYNVNIARLPCIYLY